MKSKQKVTKTVIPKIRSVWNVSPVTKVIPDKTKYNRKVKHKKSYETQLFQLINVRISVQTLTYNKYLK